ncbi:MAG: helix-turn-helix domain-containing protein [Clostridium sp.]|nr:helix-turn-helix domain-containing protein [Clostridium sp.]
MRKISDDLKKFFRDKGLTQEKIAEALDVSQPYVAQLISQKVAFGKANAKKWGEKFGLNPVWLLTGEGDMLKPAERPTEIRKIDEVKEGGMATQGNQSPIYKEVKIEIDDEVNSDDNMPTTLMESQKKITKLRRLLSLSEKEVARLEGRIEEQDRFIKLLINNK